MSTHESSTTIPSNGEPATAAAPANNDHGRPTREAPLTPAEVRAPSHAERARTLAAQLRTGTLSTLSNKEGPAGGGFPHGSYITFALDGADPVFLISRLATHTHNLSEDGRASLLVHESRTEDPLANGRITFLGQCRKLSGDDAASAREAFLALHPQASYYVDFSDFAFWRLSVESIRYIGGYGRMSWVDADDWRNAEADPLAASAEGMLRHMNDDHAKALVAYARAFTRASEAEEVTMTGIDRYGFEISVVTEKGNRPARVAFDELVETPTAARKALVAMVKTAREKIAAAAPEG